MRSEWHGRGSECTSVYACDECRTSAACGDECAEYFAGGTAGRECNSEYGGNAEHGLGRTGSGGVRDPRD